MADLPNPRRLAQGMGTAVAKRTVFRPEDHQSWTRVATRVAAGNLSLIPEGEWEAGEFEALRATIASGALITSGRHLQHGDKNQASRGIEVHSNCATAPASFLLFYLLLNGSGVGRAYDDSLMLVDWANAPKMYFILSKEHKDYPKSNEEAKTYLATFMDSACLNGANCLALFNSIIQSFAILEQAPGLAHFYRVEDSREGWGKAAEILEAMAYHRDSRALVLDFSDVRPLGAPIGGMQDRPASGPLSLIRAFINVQKHVITPAKRGYIQPWEQAMRIDHYLSAEVQVGGARRSARMSSKDWHDPGIMDFIQIKSKGGLWTSNNSVTVDAEFWQEARRAGTRAKEIFDAVTANAYINGEPGFINGDKLEDAMTGFDRQRRSATIGAKPALPTDAFAMAASPCITRDTKVFTEQGWYTVDELMGKPFVAVVNGIGYPASGFFYNGQQIVYILRTNKGTELRITPDHEIMTSEGWCPMSMVRHGMELVLPAESNGRNHALVVSVLPTDTPVDVYGCVVADVRCYNADGVMVRG